MFLCICQNKTDTQLTVTVSKLGKRKRKKNKTHNTQKNDQKRKVIVPIQKAFSTFCVFVSVVLILASFIFCSLYVDLYEK